MSHLTALALLALAACGAEAELPGEYFDIEALGDQNDCTQDGAQSFKEKFEYRLELDGNSATLAVGDDVFATGRIEGCLLTYESVVWEEDRNSGEIAWQIVGSATVNIDDACPPEVKDEDWKGTEDFEIVSADEGAGVSPGCSFRTTLIGRHVKGVK